MIPRSSRHQPRSSETLFQSHTHRCGPPYSAYSHEKIIVRAVVEGRPFDMDAAFLRRLIFQRSVARRLNESPLLTLGFRIADAFFFCASAGAPLAPTRTDGKRHADIT